MYNEECVNVSYIGYFAVNITLLFFLTHPLKVIYISLSMPSQLIKRYLLVMFWYYYRDNLLLWRPSYRGSIPNRIMIYILWKCSNRACSYPRVLIAAEKFWYIYLLGTVIACLSYRLFIATRYKFKLLTYIQEPLALVRRGYLQRDLNGETVSGR
jgi:hypothetical protein